MFVCLMYHHTLLACVVGYASFMLCYSMLLIIV